MTTCTLRFLLALGCAALVGGSALADTLLVKNGLFITMKPGEETPFTGYMTVGENGRITAVGKGDPPPGLNAGRVIDAGGKFIAPGFISSHTHLGSAPFRGVGTADNLYGWIVVTGRLQKFITADDAYWFSRAGATECLRNGITTVYDFTAAGSIGGRTVAVNEKIPPARFKPGPFDENQLKAKLDAGIRFINSVTLVEVGTQDEIVARFDKFLASSQAQYGDNPLFLKMAISGQQQFTPTKETAVLEARVMKKYGLLNETHFLESPQRLPEQRAKFDWYVEAGALGPNLIFGHFIHATPDMIAAAARTGASMSWQPMSNGRLASGVADIVTYRAAGIKVGVGLDGGSCADTFDPFGSLRTGLSLIRAKYENAKILSVYDMLHLHTMGGAEILQIADQVGSLEAGKFADFLIVDPRNPDLGPTHDAVGTYVLACGLRNLKQVYVGGKLVADGATLVGQDEVKLRDEVDARVARILASAEAEDKKNAGLGLPGQSHPFAIPALATR